MGRIKDIILERETNPKAYEELKSIKCDKNSKENDD